MRVHGVDEFGNAVLPSPDVGFGISLRGRDSRRSVEMRCGDGFDGFATDHYYVGGAGGGPTGERLPRATLNGYWLSDGIFELMYTCSGSGGYLMHLWYRDPHGAVHEMATSPQALEVQAAPSDARGSTLFEGGLSLQKNLLPAGTKLSAFLQVADRFSNAREPIEGELEVWLDGPRSRKRLNPNFFRNRGESWAASMSNPDGVPASTGTCEIRDDLEASGEYMLSALLLGEHVLGSPIEMLVVPAQPDGLHSLLVPPPYAMIAHEAATFVVQPKDRYGNAPPVDDLERAVALGAVVARVDGPTRPKCAIRARGDGSLDVSILVELSGDYRLHVWVGGTQLPACPFPVRVHANRAAANGDVDKGSDELIIARDALSSARSARAWSPPRSPPKGSPIKYNLDRTPRETSLDSGAVHQLVFSPAGVEGHAPPHTRSLGSSASWATRSPTTPRARVAAAAAAKAAPMTPPRGSVKRGESLASPRTVERKGGRSRSGGLGHSASAMGFARTPHEMDRAHSEVAAQSDAFERHELRSPGELRSPMKWADQRNRRTYSAQIAARGGVAPGSTRRNNFWASTE